MVLWAQRRAFLYLALDSIDRFPADDKHNIHSHNPLLTQGVLGIYSRARLVGQPRPQGSHAEGPGDEVARGENAGSRKSEGGEGGI